MNHIKLAQGERAVREFMKAAELGSHDGTRAKALSLWAEGWDQAITQAALELKALEKHDEANEVLKLK